MRQLFKTDHYSMLKDDDVYTHNFEIKCDYQSLLLLLVFSPWLQINTQALHLGLLSFSSQHFGTGGILTQKVAKCVLFETGVSQGLSSFGCLLSRVHKYKHLILTSMFHHFVINNIIHQLETQYKINAVIMITIQRYLFEI